MSVICCCTHCPRRSSGFICFSIAGSYLDVVLSWGPYVGVDTSKYPVIRAYFDRVKALTAVAQAHEKMATKPSST
jgi:glutathione S-transferase